MIQTNPKISICARARSLTGKCTEPLESCLPELELRLAPNASQDFFWSLIYFRVYKDFLISSLVKSLDDAGLSSAYAGCDVIEEFKNRDGGFVSLVENAQCSIEEIQQLTEQYVYVLPTSFCIGFKHFLV